VAEEEYTSPFTVPFKAKKVYEEGEARPDFVNVRLNQEEREVLNRLKYLLNIEQDSKALKFGCQIALNVLHNTLTDKMLRYISTQKDKQ